VNGAASAASLGDVTSRRVSAALSRKLLIPGMISGVLLVAACGANDDTAVPAGTASPTPAPAVPADPGDASATATTTTGTGTSDPSTIPAEPSQTLPGEPTPTPPILEFTAPLVGGGQIDGASLAGTPVLFWFWAPF
jgi:hypothetical protein